VKLSTVVVFGVGYVMGTKAGRERYAEIVKVAQKVSRRLDDLSERADRKRGADNDESARRDGEYADDIGGGLDSWEHENAVPGSRREGVGDRAFAGNTPADAGRDRPPRPG
jgi:hypothetical protein